MYKKHIFCTVLMTGGKRLRLDKSLLSKKICLTDSTMNNLKMELNVRNF